LKRKQKRVDRSQAGAPATPGTPQLVLSRSRRLLFIFIGFVLLPLLLLGALESGLRLGGYGYPTGFFKRIQIGNEEFLVENDKFGLRFFPPELSRSPAPVVMRAKKPPGTYRVFILGESAALGDPKPAYGAGRYLQALLQERFPTIRFEVVCVAITAINSHAILPIARDCARQDGDLWIIYMGNNEMVGPFGAATIFGAQSPPLAYVRLTLALQRTRVGQLLVAGGRKLTGRAKSGVSWGGMKMFMENRIAPDDRRKQSVYENFSRNLENILRTGRQAGMPVILNTVAVNLKDCAPFASVSDTNVGNADRPARDQLWLEGTRAEAQADFPEAAQKYERAAKLDPRSAQLQFQLGSALLRLTNDAAAAEHFARARDFDVLPFRADSRINELVMQAGRRKPAHELALCDASALFASNSPGNIPGREWFYEHVHFNFDGNYVLGRAWAERVEPFLPGIATNRAAGTWASQETCERRLALTDWNRSTVLEDMLRRLRQAPFTNQLNHAETVESLQTWLRRLRHQMDKQAMARAREVYLEALKRAPEDHRLHENFAEFLTQTGDLAHATEEWRRVQSLIPHHHVAWFEEGQLLRRQGKLADAEPPLLRALNLRPDLAEGWLELGNIHALEGKTEQALKEYERERKLAPEDDRVYYHIGKALSKLGRNAEAMQNLRQALRLNPSFWEARYALGEELGIAGRVPEARKELEEAIRLKPDYAPAHLNLGVALVQLGQLDAALQQFQETLRLDPQNKLAVEYYDKVRQKTGAAKTD
jgi:tetratricopeptide (TPR) repeat protein